MEAEKDTTVAPLYPANWRNQSQGTGISPWACYQCKSDKTTPSCGICFRNEQDCRYPSTAQKPGPKLGSYHKRKARPSNHRHYDKDIPVPQLPKSRSDDYLGEDSDTEDVPLHQLLAHKAKSNSISSWILHHFHEKQVYYEESDESRRNSSSPQTHFIPTPPKAMHQNNTTYVCAALEICEDELLQLTELYFSDLMSISLFHRPTFQQRINNELDPEQSTALLASMFSLSARHLCSDRDNARNEVLNPSKFYEIASNLVHKQLRNFGDKSPPLFLLQTFIMTTYYELVSGVRGVAWRSLGAVIRIAYELRLHLVDLPLKLSSTSTDLDPVEVWIAKEERRRAWWTLWEFEVFATTIRKCPLGMDPKQHATLLPVDDTFWFNGKKTPSCFFEADPVLRWKELKKSDNESGRAWLIVINSFMRDAHSLSNASVPVESSCEDDTRSYERNRLVSKRRKGQDLEMASKLAVLDNCVSCFSMSLPQRLRYRSELLFSSTLGQDQIYARRRDNEKQTIHAMIHLAKMMILHKDCFHNDYRDAERQDDASIFGNTVPSLWPGESNSHRNSVWLRYLDAAENVVSIVRNASIDHIRYGDPLLVNTFWIVAAIQLVQRTFAKTKSEKVMAQSNFDLLRLTLIQHEQYWNTSPVLLQNLEKLQSTLSGIKAHVALRSSLMNQANATPCSPEQEFTPRVHGDANLKKNSSPICRALEENEQSITTDCVQQVGLTACEGTFSLDNSDYVRDVIFNGSNLDFAMDLPVDTIFSEIWQNSQLNDFCTDSDILGPYVYSDNLL